MKNSFFITLLFLATLSSTAYAQTANGFGFKVGLNYKKFRVALWATMSESKFLLTFKSKKKFRPTLKQSF